MNVRKVYFHYLLYVLYVPYLLAMRILGIDPGLATIGIGCIERGSSKDDLRLLDSCTIETPKGLSHPMRLQELASDLRKVLQDRKPDLAVVEKLYFQTNVKTAMDVAEARGVILLTLAESGIEILEPTPLQLKLAVTGDGKADKRQVSAMLRLILKLPQDAFALDADDVTDAVALAVYGAVQQDLTLREEPVR